MLSNIITINTDTTVKEPYKHIMRILILQIIFAYVLIAFFIFGDVVVKYNNITDENICLKEVYRFIR